MADEALEPASANPFDVLAENDNQPVAKAPANPFDQIGPDLGEGSSTSGAFGRAAARGVIPSLGAFPAMGAGAQLGAAAGTPAGPIGMAVGGVVGALAGGLAGATAVSAAQDWAISKLPDSWQEALGQDDRQRKLDEQQHGTAAFLGGMLPTVLTMKPGLPAKTMLRENATALERIMSYPATAAVFGGGVMGGMELGTELAHGESPNWTHVAVATGVGVVFNRTTGFGERLIESGARPARRALGQPEPAPHEALPQETEEPAPAATPEVPEGTSPIEQALAKPVTERDWNETILGQKPAPTLYEAADAKVMGPGVTESVFMGTQEQSPSAALTSQQAVRNERLVMGESPVVPDVQSTARQMEPEAFERYDALRAQQEDFRRWIAESEESGGAPAAVQHLRAIDAEIEAISPEIRAAHRRAADAIGGPVVDPTAPQNVSRETIASDAVPIGRSIAEQRNFIARDVARQLIAAGRPEEEAVASGALIAARVETRSRRMGGVLGSPEELYRREGAVIRGSTKGSKPTSESGALQPHVDRSGIRPEQSTDLVVSIPPPAKVSGLFGGESGIPVMDQVRRAAVEKSEVLDSVVRLVPVDVVNNLFGSERAAKMALHDEAMLKNSSAFDAQLPIADLSERARSVRLLIDEVTRAGTEGASVPLSAAGKPREGVTAVGTDEVHYQGGSVRNASITFGRGKPLIRLLKSSDASSFVHETGHQWLEELMRDSYHPEAPNVVRDDAQTVRDWLGVKDPEDIKTKHHEKFARGFEQYVREGVAPSPQLAGVFARFKDWLVSIYETLKGLGAPINDDIRGVFDRMIAMEPQRTVVAPEREPTGPTIHDIHETEARDLTPTEAAPAADRVAAETDRFAAELPPEVKRELETEIAKIEPQPAAGGEPAGETGAGAGEGPAVGPSSGKPGALTAGGDGGAQSGKVSESGGGSAAESTRPADVDTGNPLAPKPTDLFGAEQSPFLDKAGNIRLDTLTNLEDARQAIRDAAAANQDFIGDRRGVVTDGQVMDVARAAGMEGAERLVRDRIVGQAFSAEEVMTLRLALVRSATDLSATMKKAAIGTDADVLAYAQAKDRHQLLQATVAQATSEAGRALRAFRNITGMTGEAKNADLFAREATGKTLFQLRQEARQGATLDTPEAVSKWVADSQKRTYGRMTVEYLINGFLSGPATQSTNAIGNTILALQHAVPETAAAALIGKVRKMFGREGETIRFGEIPARLKGMAEGLPSALKGAGQSFKAGTNMLLPTEEGRALPYHVGNELAVRPVLDEGATYAGIMTDTFGTVQGLRDGFMAMGALLKAGGVEGAPVIGAQFGVTGAIPDLAVRGVNVLPVGTAIRLPGRFLSAADSFFGAVNYSAAKNARAYRMASEEGLTGTAFDARVADIRQNPSEEMMREIVEESSKLRLMEKGGQFLQRLSSWSNAEVGGFPVLKLVMPFVNVAGNIIRQSLIERTPIAFLSAEIRADLMGKNGNIAQDMAAARILVGTAMAITVGSLAAEGVVTGSGPTDPKEKAVWLMAGNKPNSVKIGDAWYSVQKLGPLGMLMGVSADLYDVSKSASEGEMSEAAGHLVHAFSQNVLDQSAMKGVSDLLRAVNDSDRYGSQYVRNFLSSFVPFSVGMSQVARSADPYSRQTRTVVDAIRAKIPGHLDSYFDNPLFPKRDLFGEMLRAPETVGGSGVTGIQYGRVSTDPVVAAMMDAEAWQGPVPRKIRNVDLTDEQFDLFSQMAGRMSKHRLDIIVNSPDYQRWPTYVKKLVIDETFKQSREVARGMIMAKFPQIVKDATEAKLEKFRD